MDHHRKKKELKKDKNLLSKAYLNTKVFIYIYLYYIYMYTHKELDNEMLRMYFIIIMGLSKKNKTFLQSS